MTDVYDSLQHFAIPPLLAVGIVTLFSLYAGRLVKLTKLPSLIGFMLVGVLLGPSGCHLITTEMQQQLSFITEIALGFVAFTIGLELSIATLKNLGWGIGVIIFAESFGAFFLVAAALLLVSGNWPLALVFGAMAPASAPAGTVAIIQEYKAKGNLTKALYAVVGFDDGLAIIIFGFAAAIARNMLTKEISGVSIGMWASMLAPLKEIFFSFVVGAVLAYLFCFLLQRIKDTSDLLILTFAFVAIINGISTVFHLSLILTNMVWGFILANRQPSSTLHKISRVLGEVMPLLFLLFFMLAGANLHLKSLPALGLAGVVYIAARTVGLMGGAYLGAMITKAEDNIRKYLGLGILSQAGVAIGLALIIKHDLHGMGKILTMTGGIPFTTGDWIGNSVLTTVTATCIFFEIVGPICAKIGLDKAGEINHDGT